MINKEITDFISTRLKIDGRDLIEKDIILSKILFHLVQDKTFSQYYAFKGGTCLTKCYLGYYRFSEDMDFTYLNQKDFVGKSKNKLRERMSDKINQLGKLIETIAKKLDLDFKQEDLKRDSYVRIDKIASIEKFLVKYKAGSLKQDKFKDIIDKICSFLKN